MLRTRVFSTLCGLAATVIYASAAVAQRQSYPILQEILVKQNCAILLAPADSAVGKKKPKFERDSTICHLEGIHSSEHVEESIEGTELHRSRIHVVEQEYVLQNIAGAPVIFVVHQDVPKGWRVDSDPQPVELIPASVDEGKSNQVAVFRVHARPGEIVRLHVGERHTTSLKTKILNGVALTGSGR
jgi:hypothetical protein